MNSVECGFWQEYGRVGAVVALREAARQTGLEQDAQNTLRQVARDLESVNSGSLPWNMLDYAGSVLVVLPSLYRFNEGTAETVRQLGCDIDKVTASVTGHHRIDPMEYRLYDKR